MVNWLRAFLMMVLLTISSLLIACGDKEQKGDWVNPYSDEADAQKETIFGEGGLTFFDDKKRKQDEGGSIGVNSFLWHASLDTMRLPLISADPFGGVILTDWHELPELPNERFKANIYILGRTLRADGVRVVLFRQSLVKGKWRDMPVDPQAATNIENEILTRARQLRQAAVQTLNK